MHRFLAFADLKYNRDISSQKSQRSLQISKHTMTKSLRKDVELNYMSEANKAAKIPKKIRKMKKEIRTYTVEIQDWEVSYLFMLNESPKYFFGPTLNLCSSKSRALSSGPVNIQPKK